MRKPLYSKNIKITDEQLFAHAENAEYCNAHKHCHYSNVLMTDSVAKPIDYFNRAIELKHTTVFTTNHGLTLGMYEYYDLSNQLNELIEKIVKVLDDEEKLDEIRKTKTYRDWETKEKTR